MRPAYLVPAVRLLLSSPLVAQSATNTASALKRIEQRYAKATVERDTLVLRRLESPDAVIQYPTAPSAPAPQTSTLWSPAWHRSRRTTRIPCECIW